MHKFNLKNYDLWLVNLEISGDLNTAQIGGYCKYLFAAFLYSPRKLYFNHVSGNAVQLGVKTLINAQPQHKAENVPPAVPRIFPSLKKNHRRRRGGGGLWVFS